MRLISDKTLHDIKESFGFDLLPEERSNKAMTDTIALISSRAGFRIISDFSEEETAEFNKIPKDDLEQMEEYILSKNPKAKEIFEEEAKKIKEEVLNTKI